MILNCSKIIFKIQTASVQAIIDHLTKCSSSYKPPLKSYVDIINYSNKIVEKAATFEAWENDQLVGLIAVYFNDIKSKTGFITNVSILPKYQRKGIADNLLVRSIKYGKSLGFLGIQLEVSNGNVPALSLYVRNKFTLIGKKGNKLIMERKLLSE
jgi:ribosomal protein S18 acetylase RimI-like enzyme